MNYFITGITGTVVPVIVEDLLKKDADTFFYFAIRGDAKGNGIQERFDAVLKSMDITPVMKARLAERSKLVEIDVEKENLGIDPDMYAELIARTDKILHGAADVRFDQPYETIKVSNVEFTIEIYNLFRKIKEHRRAAGASAPTLYYISTGYAYGIYHTPIPEDYPQFHPGKPDNTYAQTKAEAKSFLLDKVRMFDDRIVIFEPTIIGGSSRTGRTKTYNLHYIVMMLGYLGKLPFLTAPDNRPDIVPVDWVAAVISDIMAKDAYHQGAIRLSIGDRGAPIQHLYEVGYEYYTANDPVPGHVIPKIRFVPRWFFFSMILMLKLWYQSVYFVTRARRYRKLRKGISLLEGYFPYITENKVFENAKSMALIEKYTDCGPAPALHEIRDAAGNIVEKGYYRKTMAATLETGWGGLVDFERLAKKDQASGKSPAAAYGVSRK
jgi:thioester reductase-like protein